MTAIFSLNVPGLMAVFLVFGLVVLGASMGLLELFARRARRKPDSVPVATFLGAVATAWALALGFAAADVWTVNAKAEHAASAERSSIARLAGIAEPDALNMPELFAGLQSYSDSVTTTEWGRDLNRVPSIGVDEALQEVRLAIVRAATDGTASVLVGKMVQDFDELQDARNLRLSIGAGGLSDYKWYLVMFLTFLSLVAIAAVQADRPSAARSSLVIFTIAATVSMWILALHADPYAGVASISPAEVHAPLPAETEPAG